MTPFLVAMLLSQPMVLQQDGTPVNGSGRVGVLNCTGAGITCTRDSFTKVGTIEVLSGGSSDGGVSGAPTNATYITLTSNSTLTAERVMAAGNYTTIDSATPNEVQVDWAHGLTCSSGQALTSSGTTALACTSTLTASDLMCSGTCVGDAEIAAVSGAKVSGAVALATSATSATTATTATTATALAVDPTACTAGQFVTDVAANGTLTCATPAGGGSAWTSFRFGTTTTNSTTTPATITGFTIPIDIGDNLIARCFVVTTAAATTTGVQVTFAGPTATAITRLRKSCSSTTAAVFNWATGFGSDGRTASAGTTRCLEEWTFNVNNATNGTDITAQVDSEVSASAVNVFTESWCEYTKP